MQTMEQVIRLHCVLKDEDREWLNELVDEWSLLADLAFADLILWLPDSDDNVFWAAAQVRPTTGPTSLEDDVVGEEIAYDPEHLVTEAYLVLQNDAPDAEKPVFAAQLQGLLAALGYTSAELWAERVAAAERLAREIYQIADALAALHPA